MAWAGHLAQAARSLALLAAAGVAVADSGYDAIVVGAGVSGLAAAADLIDQGYTVLVLEGRDRIGGRIQTVQTEAGLLDLGAQWIHGFGPKNPLYGLAKDQGWTVAKAGNDEEAFRYAVNGSSVPSSASASWYRIYQELMQQVDAGEYSAGESLATAVQSFATDKELDGVARFGLSCQLATNVVQEYAADPAQLSAENFDDGADDAASEDGILAEGYDAVPKYLASRVGLDKIKTSHRVTRVSYDTEEGTVTITATTPSGAVKFSADFALVTVPLGVLKTTGISFSPGLPQGKVDAIKNLGMGTLDKVFLTFDKPFWDKEAWITCCGVFAKGPQFEFYGLNRPFPGRNTLVAFTAGSAAVDREKFSDQELVARALDSLKVLYGQAAADAKLTYSRVTRWAEDDFTFGSYSYHGVESRGLADRRALLEPIDKVLYFAGEATNDKYPSTVHGAYLSGKTAAKLAMEAHPDVSNVVI